MSDDITQELAVLRERVRILAAGLGVDEGFEVPSVVREHAAAGETVRAVKELRRRTPGRMGLVEAKRMVDALAR